MKIIITAILFSISFQIQAQNKAQFKKQLKEAVENLRESKTTGGVYAFDKYYTSIPNVILEEIAIYETDSIPEIRRFAIEIVNMTGIKNKDSLIRKAAVNKISAACKDESFSNRSTAASCLKKYDKNDFSKEAKQHFSNLLERDHGYYQHVVQLVGYLDMTEEISELQVLLSDTTHNDPKIIWKVHTALARLSVEESIDYCVSYVKSKDMNDLLVRFLLTDLAYIKQKETIGYLVSELYNDKKNCRPANPNSSGKITCAYRIMEILAPVIKDFPWKAKYGTQLDVPSYEKALKDIRIWFKEHPDYKIDRDVF